ncbi:hypothetical protein [Arthrobacter sunyaminii]|uniref:hypothetical protein n=1 Tax=Arthrobacter sunyaminii TaxID=2816859 RepID=UPI001A946DE2|nr:hypothetical protein [Arthrobacter sunyaminii]MBO0896736.1 hypothetical protein [Arthrobacter sunyaminii]
MGDRAPLLSSQLASNPFDDESAEDLRALAFQGLRRLFYLPWLQGLLFGVTSGLGADNPFVVGRVLQKPAGRESSARRHGAWDAVAYTLRITLVPLILFIVGAGILVSNAMPE